MAAAALFVALWFPTLWTPFGRDQGLWAAVADQVLRGGVAYADGITLKPPGIVYLYTWTLGAWHDMRAVRVLEGLWLAATLGLMIALLPVPRRRAAAPLLALLLGLVHFQVFLFWHMAGPDGFLALPVLAALWVRTRTDPARSWLRPVAVGALLACAFWLKYTALVFAPLFAALDLWGPRALRPRAPRTVAAAWLAAAGGFALVLGVVLADFGLRDGWRAFREVQVDFLLGYTGYRPQSPELPWSGFHAGPAGRGTRQILFWIPFVWIPALLLPVWKRRLTPWPLWLGAGLAVTGVAVQKKFFLAHWAPLVPWLCMLAALGIDTTARRVCLWLGARPDRSRVPIAVLSLAAVCALVPLSTRAGYGAEHLRAWARQLGGAPAARAAYLHRFGRYGHGDFSFVADMEAAAWLRSTTRPDQRVFIWGFEPLVYFLAERRPASRFLENATIVSPASNPAWRDELVGELKRDPPEVVLVLTGDRGLENVHGIKGDSRETLRSELPELQDWLAQNYREERQLEHFTVWRHRPPVSRP